VVVRFLCFFRLLLMTFRNIVMKDAVAIDSIVSSYDLNCIAEPFAFSWKQTLSIATTT